jgi:hypothetical protein
MIYVVKPGDHLTAIAERHGFANHDTIWNHPDNAELKQKRRNPELLAPGDQLEIPDRKDKVVTVTANMQHRFVVRTDKLELRLRIRDIASKPMAGAACEVSTISGKRQLTTNADGQIIVPIERSERRVTLTMVDQVYEIGIGELDPIDTEYGWQTRLVNLGYLESVLSGSSDPDARGDEGAVVRQLELRAAIEEFQCDAALQVTGEMDQTTQTRLVQVHGC